MNSLVSLPLAGVLALALSGSARADDVRAALPGDARTGFHADFEIDPIAYALLGYSLHVGLGYRHLRLDLGAFAADVPQFVHGNDGFDASAHGFGLKLHYYLFREQEGLFVGADAVFGEQLLEHEESGLVARRNQLSVSANVGYRVMLPAGFFVTPWVGVGYEFRGDDVVLDGQKFETSHLALFPTIHLGYRFF